MFIPIPMQINAEIRRGSVPVANWVMIAINVFVYLVFSPSTWWVGPGTMPWTILTYGFVHEDFLHLLFNMWWLWVFGNAVNRRIGNGYYVMTYLGTIVALGLIARLLSAGFVLGASGAVFAVVAVAAMLMPLVSVEVHYLAIFPVTLLISLFQWPKFWLFWFVRWGTATFSTLMLAVLVVAFQLMLMLMWLLWGSLAWTNLGHLLGFVCGVAAVLLMPSRVTTLGRRTQLS